MHETDPRPHILVIDDDDALCAILRDVFADDGFRVTACIQPPADLAEVERLAPDLILLDLVYGGQRSGFAFLESLKQDPATAVIPVVVCSAAVHVTDGDRVHMTEWECATLPKPFDIDELLGTVRGCLAEAEVAA
jgi:DNA-binding response OmpR family regulator